MIKRKRIAICISGQLRTWKKSIGSWIGFLKNDYMVDVFVHTWNFNTVSARIDTGNFPVELIDDCEINDFKKAVNPTTMVVEKEKIFNISVTSQALQKQAHLSQLYGIQMASRLKRQHEISNKMVYDTVVRLRPDLYFRTNPLEIIELSNNQVFNGFDLSWSEFNGKISDLFWITNSYFYDIVADHYLNLSKIGQENFQGLPSYGPEHVLFFYIKKNAIPIKNQDWEISIMRDSKQTISNTHGPNKDVW
jgi:hypothetical protein